MMKNGLRSARRPGYVDKGTAILIVGIISYFVAVHFILLRNDKKETEYNLKRYNYDIR